MPEVDGPVITLNDPSYSLVSDALFFIPVPELMDVSKL
jgi:hypothetical protein